MILKIESIHQMSNKYIIPYMQLDKKYIFNDQILIKMYSYYVNMVSIITYIL